MKKIALLLVSLCLFACKEETAKQSVSVVPVVSEEEQESKASFKAKVINVLGTCEKQRESSSWSPMRVGQNMIEKDRIRTREESEVVMKTPDGSSLTFAENTEIVLSIENLSFNKSVSILVENGVVHFDVQKQNASTMTFKTGTAVAAIRGTAGFVGSVGGKTVASLKEGLVEVEDNNGKKEDVKPNQTVIVHSKGISKMQLKSSGTAALASKLDSIKADESADLEKTLAKFDEDFSARLKDFENKVRVQATRIADTVFVPSITLQARVTPGVIVKVAGTTDTVPANGIYQREFSWEADAYGPKRFLATCSDGVVEFTCYMWNTLYAEPSLEPEPVADTVAAEPEAPKAAPKAKNLKVGVRIAGQKMERIHIGPERASYAGQVAVTLSGLAEDDLDEVKSVVLKRGGKVVNTVPANELTSLKYEFPVEVARNKIAEFEVDVTLKNGKTFKASKTYEVYCLLSNHPGGKARNALLPEDQEYERLKQAGGIEKE